MTAANPGDGAAAAGELTVCAPPAALRRKRRYDAVITIEDPGCRRALQLRFTAKPAPPHLVLAFEDCDEDGIGIRVAAADQVAAAIEFGREHRERSLLVHCYHGVGRSAAVALAILADRAGAGGEAAARERLPAIRPEATPNLVVVRHAAAPLDRGGALVAAVADWEARTPGLKAKRADRAAFVRAHPGLYARL